MENFEVKITADGSPTLILGEPMHNLKGAFSETNYVYGEALRLALSDKGALLPVLRVASIGLGLGYNEWMTVAHFLKMGRSLKNLELCAWEINEKLKTQFLEGAPLFAEVGMKVAKAFEVDEKLLKEGMEQLLKSQNMVLRGNVLEDLGGPLEFKNKFHLIYFDAFSSVTSPGLWSEEFLESFVKNFCDSTFCVFASYAATSRLKRALTAAGFDLIYRRGFAGKRECTLGVRV